MERHFLDNMLKLLYSVLGDSARIPNRMDFYEALLDEFRRFFKAQRCSVALRQGNFISYYHQSGEHFSYRSVKTGKNAKIKDEDLKVFASLIRDLGGEVSNFSKVYRTLQSRHSLEKEKLIPVFTDGMLAGVLSLRDPAYPVLEEWDKWTEHVSTLMEMIFLNRSLQHSLRERGKENRILYHFCKLSGRPDSELDDLLSTMVKMLPDAWQYPENTVGEIKVNGKLFSSSSKKKYTAEQISDIQINKETVGYIKVAYTKEKPEADEGPFLREERSLIDALAKQLALIVEKKIIEEQSKKLQQQLRHADRLATIGQLAAGVAHELNEPLGNILGFAQLVKAGNELPTQALRDIEKIEASSLYAREVIKKLMLFSRQMPPHKVHVNLNQIIDEGLYFIEARSSKAGIKIDRDLKKDLPEIIADPAQLYQVLVNIVVNAIHAIKSNGLIKIRTGATKDEVFFSVEDNGCGMDEETANKIFIPFFTTKDIDEGTGLGLPVCHGILKAHGGRIDVQSTKEKGSTFTVLFPKVKE